MSEAIKVLIVNEKTAFQSVVSDVFTFVCLLGSIWLNHVFLGASWVVEIVVFIGFLTFVCKMMKKNVRKMSSKDALNYLREKEQANDDRPNKN